MKTISETSQVQKIAFLLLAVLLAGCATGKREGTSVTDALDDVRIEQMAGNDISGAIFERTIVCLNARRETRQAPATTNQSLVVLTNLTLSYVTNQTITVTTNQQVTLATNLQAPQLVLTVETNQEAGAVAAAPAPSGSTNVALTTASNLSLSKAGNQISTSANFQTQRARQFTTTEHNISITTGDTQIITAETNQVVNVFTNVTLTTMTNQNVTYANTAVQEHFLVLEYTPPPDFTLASGESLVLLVDGERHALAPGTTQSVVVPRRGFNAVAYKATPQLLVNVANAREVRVRIKGATQVIERSMSQASRLSFKKFLVKFFTPSQTEEASAMNQAKAY